MPTFKRISISSRFIESKAPIKLKWLFIDILNRSIDYKISYDEYINTLKRYDEKIVNQFSKYSKCMKINGSVVELDKYKLRKYGISLNSGYQIKQEEINFERVAKLLKAYNEVRDIYYEKQLGIKSKQVLPVALKPNLTSIYNKVLSFLDTNNITDFFLYFYCLHYHSEWKFVWSLKSCYSPRCLDIYTSRKETCQTEIQRVDDKILAKQQDEFEEFSGSKHSRWIHLYPHIERIKRRHIDLGQEKICLSGINYTLGYHPLSDECIRCALKVACSKQIYKFFQNLTKSDLDILKLRGKIISVEEAKSKLKQLGLEFNFYE